MIYVNYFLLELLNVFFFYWYLEIKALKMSHNANFTSMLSLSHKHLVVYLIIYLEAYNEVDILPFLFFFLYPS